MFSVKIITVDAVPAVIPRLSGEAIVSPLGIVVQRVSKKDKFPLTFLVKNHLILRENDPTFT